MLLASILLNHFALTLIKAISKILIPILGQSLLLLIRNFLAAIALVIIALYYRQLSLKQYNSQIYGLYALRGIFQALAMQCGSIALVNGSIANSTLVGFTEPLFVATLGYLILGEYTTYRRVFCMLGCSFGVLILCQGSCNAQNLISIGYMLLANFFASCSIITSKRLVLAEGVLRSSAITGCFVTIFLGFEYWQNTTATKLSNLSMVNFLFLLLSVFLVLIHRYCFLYTLKFANIDYIAMFQYLGIVMSVLLSHTIDSYQFGITFDFNTLFGTLIILAFLYFS